MTAKIILTLDVGSSSVRCTSYHVLDRRNKGESYGENETCIEAVLGCSAFQTIRSVEPNTGKICLEHSLFHKIDMIIDETISSLRQHFAHISTPFRVVGLGFSSFVMNLVALDENGHVVGADASLSYACNTLQVAEQCHRLRADLGPKKLAELYQRTGAPLHSAYALPQLCALYANPEHQPCKNVHIWQTIASACLSRWTGRDFLPISYSEASWTGLLNFRTCQWDEEALSLLPEECRNALPPLADCTDPTVMENGIQELPQYCTSKIDTTTKNANPYWKRWPELRGQGRGNNDEEASSYCRLFLGIGDGACANIGSKCSTPSRIAVTIGTSAAVRVCLPMEINTDKEINVPHGLFCYRVDRSRVLLGGALTDGGSAIEWARSLLNLENNEDFETCMKKVQNLVTADYEAKHPKASLSMIPFLSGERSTGFRNHANGGMLGLTRNTTTAHFVKACMESVALRLQAILNIVRKTLENGNDANDDANKDDSAKSPPFIIASGTALEKNQLWRQMIADCSGMVVKVDRDSNQGTSRGVAIMVVASLAMLEIDSAQSSTCFPEECVTAASVSEPHLTATNGYWKREAHAQNQLINAVMPLWS